jgi:hypothetical protein
MSKNLFLLLILTITTCNNSAFAMAEDDILKNLDEIHKDPKNSSTMLGSLVSNIRGMFGPKKQNSIAQELFVNQELSVKKELLVKEDGSSDRNGAKDKNQELSVKGDDWCGTKTGQIRNKAKTLFGISFDKRELMYFGASAVVLITLGGVVYVICKNEYTKKWTLEKVSQDMQKFAGEHKTAVTSTVVAAIVTAIALLYAKKQGITFESASSWVMNGNSVK